MIENGKTLKKKVSQINKNVFYNATGYFIKILSSLMLFSSFSLTLHAQTLEKDTIKMQKLTIYANGKLETINWQKISLDKAQQKAQLEGKRILIYFTAKWCAPCRKMEQEVFQDYTVIRAVNDNFIALKIDVDAWGGKKWKEDFGVKGMPEFFILDASKQRLRHNLGAVSLNEFLQFLNLKENPSNLKFLDTTHTIVRAESWKSKLGLGVGLGASNLSNAASTTVFGSEVWLGYSLEKKRLFFNPTLSFSSIGSSISRLNYIRIPVQVALNFYRGSVLGLPGGFRALAAPYYGRLLNRPKNIVNRNDMGLDYGLGIYIGDADNANLEFSLRGSQGYTDILPQAGKQTNQFFRAAITMSIRKG